MGLGQNPSRPTRFGRLAWLLIVAVLVFTVAVEAAAPVVSWRWTQWPFLSVLLEHTLVVSSIHGESWQINIPGNGTTRLMAVDGRPVANVRDLEQVLQDLVVGDEVPLTFQERDAEASGLADDGGQYQVQVVAQRFPLSDWVSLFWLPYAVGLVYLAIGVWVFRHRGRQRSGQSFALFSAFVALSTGTLFDINSTYVFSRIWTAALPLAGAALVHLALVFPEEGQVVRRWPLTRFVPYALGAVLVVVSQVLLYTPGNPWAYISGWRLNYIGIGLAAIVFFLLVFYTRARTVSGIVRQQVRIILLGSLLAFSPMVLYMVLAGLAIDVRFIPALYLSPMIIFPVFIAFAILRYKLLGMDLVVSRGLAYTILTASVAGTYFLVLTVLGQGLGIQIATDNPLLLAFFVVILIFVLNPLRAGSERLVDRLLDRRRVNYREALQDYSRELVTTPLELTAILKRLLAHIEPVAHSAPALIFLYDPLAGDYTLCQSSGFVEPEELDTGFGRDGFLVRWLGEQDRPVYLTDSQSQLPDGEMGDEEWRKIGSMGLVLFLPVRGKGKRSDEKAPLEGWVALGPRLSGEPYSPDDLNFLAALVDQTAIAIDNARLLDDLEQQVVRLDVLRQIGEAVDLRRDLDDLLDLIYQQTIRVLEADNFYVALYDQIRQEFRMAFYVEEGERRQPESVSWPLGTGLTSQIVRSGQKIITDDYLAECLRRGVPASGRPAKAWLGVPLEAGPAGWVLGVLNVSSFQPGHRYSPEQVQLMCAIADQAAVAIDRMRLYQEMEIRAAELATLNEVSRTINSTLDLPNVLDLIMSKVVELFDVEAGSLLLLDEESGDLVFQVALGGRDSQVLVGRRHPISKGIIGSVAQSGEPLIVNDAKADARWDHGVDREIGFVTHSVMCVPMISRDRVIGVIEVINHRNRSPFEEEEANLLVSFAGQAAVAIENARLYTRTDQALARRVEELSMMQRIDRELNAALDFDRVMDMTMEWALRVTGAPVGVIALYDEKREGLLLLTSRGYPLELERFRQDPWPLGRGIAGRVVRSGEPALIDDVTQDADYSTVQPSTRSQLTVPIRREDRVIGVVNLESPELGAFDSDDLAFALRLADHAAIAIENARLHAETERHLQEQVALRTAGGVIASSLDLETVLARIAEQMGRAVDATSAYICDHDPETRTSTVIAEYISPQACPEEQVSDLGVTYEEQEADFLAILRDGRHDISYIDDPDLGETERSHMERYGVKTILYIPLLVRERLIGFTELWESRRQREFSPEEIALCQGIAQQAAIGIENAHLYEGVREADRAKSEFIDFVAHELKQPMTAMQGYSKLLTIGIGGELNDTQREFVEVINSNVDRMGKLVNDLLEISRLEAGRTQLKLSPVSLKEIVEEAITNTRTEIEARRHSLEVETPEDLPPVLGDRERLVQILTNLVSNAYKYTPEGGTIRIAVDGHDHPKVPRGHVCVSVSDTGIGLSPQDIAGLEEKFFRADHDLVQQQPGTGLGVSITRNLVKLHGGEFLVESEPGQGSTFSFTVPIADMESG